MFPACSQCISRQSTLALLDWSLSCTIPSRTYSLRKDLPSQGICSTHIQHHILLVWTKRFFPSCLSQLTFCVLGQLLQTYFCENILPPQWLGRVVAVFLQCQLNCRCEPHLCRALLLFKEQSISLVFLWVCLIRTPHIIFIYVTLYLSMGAETLTLLYKLQYSQDVSKSSLLLQLSPSKPFCIFIALFIM